MKTKDGSELNEKYVEVVKAIEATGMFNVYGINQVNHDPHPYTIGARHVSWASEHCGGMLTEASIREAEKHGVHCAHPKCRLPFDQHTSKTVVFLQLTRNITPDEAKTASLSFKDLADAAKIDGMAFVETPEKYRVQ